MARVKDGKLDINRTMYKDIKKYDREQMNSFLQDIYETGVKNGYEKGLQSSSKGLSGEEKENAKKCILNEISGIKGIGPSKLEEIGAILEKRLKELVQDEQK